MPYVKYPISERGSPHRDPLLTVMPHPFNPSFFIRLFPVQQCVKAHWLATKASVDESPSWLKLQKKRPSANGRPRFNREASTRIGSGRKFDR